jgi:endonuclease/exonuclease/phosphatase family metal-dependent hydrolase
MKYFLPAVLVFCLMPVFTSCFGSCGLYPGEDEISKDRTIGIASWNVQALFDGTDEGIEYEEYRSGSGWNGEKYEARVNGISAAINGIRENGPDVVVLIELENAAVLEALSKASPKKNGYRHSFFAGHPGYSLGLGLLSRYRISRSTAHSCNTNGEVLPRPIAEVWLEPGGSPLVLFICHWKSKLGGDLITEKLRRDAAKVILRRCAEIRAEFPDMPFLVLGDLNENHDEFYRHGSAETFALMPDDPEASRRAGFLWEESIVDNSGEETTTGEDTNGMQRIVFLEESPADFFVICEDKPPSSAYFPYTQTVFFSPWNGDIPDGSYLYGGSWETIDHFLLSDGFWSKKGWMYKSASALNVEPFVNSKGEPAPYNPRTGSGLSDHLPILLVLGLE